MNTWDIDEYHECEMKYERGESVRPLCGGDLPRINRRGVEGGRIINHVPNALVEAPTRQGIFSLPHLFASDHTATPLFIRGKWT